MMMDNIGLNPVPYNLAFGDNATVGGYDGEILVSLNAKRKYSTQQYMMKLRAHLKEKFPPFAVFLSTGRYGESNFEFRTSYAY